MFTINTNVLLQLVKAPVKHVIATNFSINSLSVCISHSIEMQNIVQFNAWSVYLLCLTTFVSIYVIVYMCLVKYFWKFWCILKGTMKNANIRGVLAGQNEIPDDIVSPHQWHHYHSYYCVKGFNWLAYSLKHCLSKSQNCCVLNDIKYWFGERKNKKVIEKELYSFNKKAES